MKISKDELFRKVLEELERERQTLVRAAEAAYDGATNAEVKQENKYDTRGLESSYLALGQSRRAQEIAESIGRVQMLQREPISSISHARIASVVTLENESRGIESHYFLLPGVGGMKIAFGNSSVQVISSSSPLAKEILGKSPGDTFTFQSQDFCVVDVD